MVKAERDDDELNLINYLFEDYNKVVRPVWNKSNPIDVRFGLAYVQLVDLVSKIFSVSLATNENH